MADPSLLDLANLASNAAYTFSLSSPSSSTADNEDIPNSTTPETLARLQTLFNVAPTRALPQTNPPFTKSSHPNVSDDFSDTVESEKQTQEFGREAWKFESGHQKPMVLGTASKDIGRAGLRDSRANTNGDVDAVYALRLEPPLESAEVVQVVAGLSNRPKVVHLDGEAGSDTAAEFCTIDHVTHELLVAYIIREHAGFQPTIVRLR